MKTHVYNFQIQAVEDAGIWFVFILVFKSVCDQVEEEAPDEEEGQDANLLEMLENAESLYNGTNMA